ncbi:MAG: hypothetical protein IIC22_05745, partial [Chloroflexi bacterium]|nr:hypothetical protein [Chloroflexota bacterium]
MVAHNSVLPPSLTERFTVRRIAAWTWTPLVVLFLFTNIVLIGPLLWGSGLPKGIDLNASLTTGYEAKDGAWHQLWDDSQFPGKPKNVSRFTSSELIMTWLVEITGSPFASARIMVWLLSVVALVAMYALVFAITRSRLAAVVAAVVYVFSRGSLLQTGIPLAAGFALTPLVFLAVDRVLVGPSMRRALLLALV